MACINFLLDSPESPIIQIIFVDGCYIGRAHRLILRLADSA
jgi:hypothetical protein